MDSIYVTCERCNNVMAFYGFIPDRFQCVHCGRHYIASEIFRKLTEQKEQKNQYEQKRRTRTETMASS